MLGLLLPFVWLRGIGAGDWKLLGALGALLGPKQIVLVLVVSTLFAGLMGVVEMIRRKAVKGTLGNLWELVKGLLVFGVRPHPVITLDNPKLLKLPLAVPVAAATMICFVARGGIL